MNNNFLNKEYDNLEIKDGIMKIASRAQLAKKTNPKVIDSTIGMLYTEEDHLHVFQSVNHVEDMLTQEDKFKYSTSSGHIDNQKLVEKWILGESSKNIKENCYVRTILTMGATSAINCTIAGYLKTGDRLLISDCSWDAYEVAAFGLGGKVEKFTMFNDNVFNIESFKKHFHKLAKEQDNIVLIINDPCHNPTGYTLKNNEWDAIIHTFESVENNVVLILDTAYVEFSKERTNFRKTIEKLSKSNANLLTVVAFSGSKTFGLYGLRIGAATAIHKNKEIVDGLYNFLEYKARGTWSNISRHGESIVAKILDDNDLTKIHLDEINKEANIIASKIKELKKWVEYYNLEMLPCEEGFFATFPSTCPPVHSAKLEEQGIYTVPLDCGIRIALCSTHFNDIQRLCGSIKNIINEHNDQ